MGLDVGEQAPDFELRNQHGEDVSLSKYRGAKNVVAVFYPFAFSGVCTGEMREIRDRLPAFQNDDVQLVAISCDPLYALRVFADQEGLDYPLLSDFWPHGEVAMAYGVFDAERGCAGRASFVIDRDGVVRWSVHNALPDARSLAEYERVLGSI
jgi:mycoredoxin-dependent peroxiredoxin